MASPSRSSSLARMISSDLEAVFLRRFTIAFLAGFGMYSGSNEFSWRGEEGWGRGGGGLFTNRAPSRAEAAVAEKVTSVTRVQGVE